MTVNMSSGITSCCCVATAIPPRQITCNGKWRSANCRVSLSMGFASSALPAPRSTSRISLQRLLMSWNCKRGRNHSTRFSSPTERWGAPSTIPLKLCKKEKRDRKCCIGVFFGVRGILQERKYWIFFFLEFERIQVDHWRILFILHLTFFTGIPGLLSTQLLPQEPWHVEDQKTLGTRLAFHCFAVPITTTEKWHYFYKFEIELVDQNVYNFL